MQNLFAFIFKHRFIFIFILLEAIAISMVINHSIYQRYVFLNRANRITGTIYSWNTYIADYFSLRNTNQILAEENARLRGMLEQSQYMFEPERDDASDVISQQQFAYIPARVLSNSTNKRNNYLMIDRGSRHGIKREMAVIAPDGVVGIVLNVSENFAWVMSVLNQHAKINGRFKNTSYQGSLSWDGRDYRTGTLSDVPSHVQIQTGDTVVTSGYSLIFPPDIMIGTVKDHFIGRGDHFYTVKLHFSVDYNRLSQVYVVKNLMLEEQLSIIEQL